jgi:hypothetical protein
MSTVWMPGDWAGCWLDACPVRGVGARALAAFRAFLVSLLHRGGVREKKAALESFSGSVAYFVG